MVTSQQTVGQACPWARGQMPALGATGAVAGPVAIPVAGGAQASP